MNIRANNSFERRKPSSVKTTDFALAHWIVDHSFLVQPVHGVPIKAFPGTPLIMTSEIEQREDSVVYSIFIERHEHPCV